MGIFPRSWRPLLARFAGGLAVPLLLALEAPAQTPNLLPAVSEAPAAVAAPAPSPSAKLNLTQCIQLAMEQQPTLAAQQASLAASEASLRGLERLHVPTLLSAGRELAIRRKQAKFGITIASAGLAQAEFDTTYAVTRTYLTVLYARQQEKVAASVVRDMNDIYDVLKRVVGEVRNLSQNDLDKTQTYVYLAENKVEETKRGSLRALAALREAMGVGPDYIFEIADEPMPKTDRKFTRDEVVALALARRGEMTQAVSAAQLTCLEIDAQGTLCGPTARTFAAGADIHSRPIPQGTSNGEYRPGAIGIEMPTMLAGPKANRVERARALHERAEAVVAKTKNLIALEAEDAFLKWEEAAQKVDKAGKTADRTELLAKNSKSQFTTLPDRPNGAKDWLEAAVLAGQIRGQHNEALYQQALGVAALERITAGGVSAAPAQP